MFTLHVKAREVLLDVIARDFAYRTLSSLRENDFQIFEIVDNKQKRQRRIVAFSVVDPALKTATPPVEPGGFHVALRGGCAARITVHYQISFQPSPDGWKAGHHEILVTTSHPGVTLTFHHSYFVGQTEDSAPATPIPEPLALASLKRAACYHGDIPASMALNGQLLDTTPNGQVRYSIVIQPDSLAFSSISNDQHRVGLDYGACVFNRDGDAIQFMHHSTDKVLSSADYQKALTDGLPNRIDLPRRPDAAMIRMVVRDRATGNLGVMELLVGADPADKKQVGDHGFRIINGKAALAARPGTFGSILPQSPAFCGDVYEIQTGTPQIISNFGEQDSVGMIYTPTLEVPKQRLVGGLPGITPNEQWFSIDYYGEFWTTTPGNYLFRLQSDDGANLYIDDQLVITQDGIHPTTQAERSIPLNPGRHTIHLPYFQGPLVVTLILEVKAPGKSLEAFDLRKFPPPATIKIGK